MALTKIGKEGITGISNSSDANAITIDSSERVGIGLSSNIDRKLHVEVDNTYAAKFGGTAGGDFAIEIGQTGTNGSAGFNATGTGGAMKFSISGSEAMRITQNNNLAIGTTSEFARLHVTAQGDATTPALFEDTRTGSTSTTCIVIKRNGSNVGAINTTDTSTAYVTSSDARLKENVVDMTGAIDRVKQLSPKRFNFIADADTTVDGFLAHEAQTVVAEAVTGTHNEVDDDGNPVMQGIDQSKLVPLLTGALKEAIAKIEDLEARIATLEGA